MTRTYSASDRFSGEFIRPVRDSKLQQALQALWEEIEAGYILSAGKYTCGQCRSKPAESPQQVRHEEGCIQGLCDSISSAAVEEIKDFATAILHGDQVHREWLMEAADAYENGRELPAPRSGPKP